MGTTQVTLPELSSAALSQMRREPMLVDPWVRLSRHERGMLAGFSLSPKMSSFGELGVRYGVWVEWDPTDPLGTMYGVLVEDAQGWAVDLTCWLEEEIHTGLASPANRVERSDFTELHRPQWGDSLLPEDLH